MSDYQMTESELRFAELIWEKEPVLSGDLVKLCENTFHWKKSTTYTVLKKLCEKGILKNENAVISAIMKKEEYHQLRSEKFLSDNYEGSLPKFLAAFIHRKKLSKKQIEEIKDMIENYKEEQ